MLYSYVMKKTDALAVLAQLRDLHNNYYTYNEAEFSNELRGYSSISVTCPVHGAYTSLVHNHLQGKGCKKCGDVKRGLKKRATARASFVAKSQAVHGEKYDYSGIDYVDSRTKVLIRCPRHGEFLQVPTSHFGGCGCPACAIEHVAQARKRTHEDFVREATEVHGGRYEYPETFDGVEVHIAIICPEHGLFRQRAASHLKGSGCPQCAAIRISEARKKSFAEFVEDARKKYGDMFLYEEVPENHKMVRVYHPDVGWETQEKASHLHRRVFGHSKLKSHQIKYTTDEFVSKAREVHGAAYGYEKTVYTGIKDLVTITCPKHGDFSQMAENHIRLACGCPSCRSPVSKIHQEILDMLAGEEVVVNDRKILAPYEIDIYLPKRNIAFEINGMWYHSSKFKERDYHQDKVDAAAAEGIQLFHLWIGKELDTPLIRSWVQNKINKSSRRIPARKTEVVVLDYKTYEEFLSKTHLQGATTSSVRYGLIHEGVLVSVMGFKKHKDGWHLERFSSELDTVVQGGFSKLLMHFQRENTPEKIISFSDAAYSSGNIYRSSGFKAISRSSLPRLYYTNGLVMHHRQRFQRKHVHERRPDIPWGSEKSMAEAEGFYQLWGCVTTRWEL